MSDEPGASAGAPQGVELRRELTRLRGAVDSARAQLDRVENDISAAKSVAVLTSVGLGLLVLLATTWLVPAGTDAQAVHDFAGARTGLGLLDGPWQTTEAAAEWAGRIGLVGYLCGAVTMLVSTHSSVRIPLIASYLGLVATITVLVVKPGNVDSMEWAYAWQSSPYIACALWVVAIFVTTRQLADSRRAGPHRLHA